MLQAIRDRMTGPLIWLIIGIIVVPFAFWGFQSFFGPQENPAIAEVGSAKITQAQFQQAYQQSYSQMLQQLGANFDAASFDAKAFRKRVLDQLIDQSVQQQFARDQGYRTSNAALLNELQMIPPFQKNGAFSPEAYQSTLASFGRKPAEFEAQLRDNLILDQVRKSVATSALLDEGSIKQAFDAQNERRSFATLVVDPVTLEAGVKVSDAQVRAQFDQHPELYRSPDRVKLAYVELALDKLAPPPAPSADSLKALYDKLKDTEFATQEQRRARHILIKFGADKAVARKKADALLEQLRAGADFTRLARENSDDAGSKAAGGELGWVPRGTLAPQFETALYALTPNQISDPVETSFGWHLIQLEELRPASVKPFDDAAVQKRLLDLYRLQSATDTFRSGSDRLEELAFENASSLDPIAKALNLTVVNSDWLTDSSGPDPVTGNPAVLKAAFSDGVLNSGENSKPISIGDNDLVVLRLVAHEPPKALGFDEVSARIRKQLAADAALVNAHAATASVLEAVKDKKMDLESAAKSQQLGDVQQFSRLERIPEGDMDASLLAAAFSISKPEAGQTGAVITESATGKPAVVVLTSIDSPPVVTNAEQNAKIQQFKAAFLRRSSEAELKAYQEWMKTAVGVKILQPDPGN